MTPLKFKKLFIFFETLLGAFNANIFNYQQEIKITKKNSRKQKFTKLRTREIFSDDLIIERTLN